jgi:hypothetical protein
MRAWTVDADDIHVAEDFDESLLHRTPEIDRPRAEVLSHRPCRLHAESNSSRTRHVTRGDDGCSDDDGRPMPAHWT